MPRRNVPRHVTFGKQQSPPKVRSIATPETAYQSQAAKGFLPELLDFDGLLSSSGLIEGQTMPERTSNDVDTIPRHNAKAWQEKVQSLNTTVHELQSIVKEQQEVIDTLTNQRGQQRAVFKEDFKAVQKEIEGQNTFIEHLQDLVEEQGKQLYQKYAAKGDLQETLTKTRSQLEQEIERSKAIQQKYEQMSKEHQSLQQKYGQMSREHQERKDEIKRVQDEFAKRLHDQQIGFERKSLLESQRFNADLEGVRAEMKQRVAALSAETEAQISAGEREAQETRLKYEYANNQLQEATQLIERLKQQLELKDDSMIDLEHSISEVQSQAQKGLSMMHDSLAELNKKYEERGDIIAKLQQRNEHLETQLAKSMELVAEQKDMLKKKSGEESVLKELAETRLYEIQKELDEEREKMRCALETRLQTETTIRKEFDTEKEVLHRTFEQQTQKLRDDRNRLVQENEELKSKSIAAQEKNSQLSEEIRTRVPQLEQLRVEKSPKKEGWKSEHVVRQEVVSTPSRSLPPVDMSELMEVIAAQNKQLNDMQDTVKELKESNRQLQTFRDKREDMDLHVRNLERTVENHKANIQTMTATIKELVDANTNLKELCDRYEDGEKIWQRHACEWGKEADRLKGRIAELESTQLSSVAEPIVIENHRMSRSANVRTSFQPPPVTFAAKLDARSATNKASGDIGFSQNVLTQAKEQIKMNILGIGRYDESALKTVKEQIRSHVDVHSSNSSKDDIMRLTTEVMFRLSVAEVHIDSRTDESQTIEGLLNETLTLRKQLEVQRQEIDRVSSGSSMRQQLENPVSASKALLENEMLRKQLFTESQLTESRCDGMTKQIESLQDAMYQLERRLADSDARCIHFKVRFQELEKSYKACCLQLEKSTSEIAKLTKQDQELQLELVALKHVNRELGKTSEEFEKRLRIAHTLAQDFSLRLDLEDWLIGGEPERRRLQEKLFQAVADSKTGDASNKKHSTTLKQENDQLKERLVDAANQNTKLVTDLEQLRSDLTSARELEREHQHEIISLQRVNKELWLTVERMERGVLAKDTMSENMSSFTTEVQQVLAGHEREIKELSHKLADAESTKISLGDELESMSRHLASLEEEVQSQNQLLEKSEERIESLIQKLDSATEECKASATLIQVLESEAQGAKMMEKTLNEIVQRTNERVESLQQEHCSALNNERQKYEKMVEQKNSLLQTVNELQLQHYSLYSGQTKEEEIDAMRRQLMAKEDQQATLEKQLTTAVDQVTQLSSELSSLRTWRQEQEIQSADLKDQFEKAKQCQSEKEEQLTDALEKARQEAEIAVKLQRERDEIKSKMDLMTKNMISQTRQVNSMLEMANKGTWLEKQFETSLSLLDRRDIELRSRNITIRQLQKEKDELDHRLREESMLAGEAAKVQQSTV